MRIKRFLIVVMLLFVSIFTTACSLDTWFNNGKYGTFRIEVANLEKYLKSLKIIGVSTQKGSGYFEVIFKAELNDNIDSVKENVKFVYVINVEVVYYDEEKNKKSKVWEDVEVSFEFDSGDRPEEQQSGSLVATVQQQTFGVTESRLKIFYPEADLVEKAYFKPLYFKSASGKVFIDRPQIELSSSVAN